MAEKEMYLQTLMNEAYDKFGVDVPYKQWFDSLDDLHKRAVMAGNTNYQVGNGGWSQLKFNYMPERSSWADGRWDEDDKDFFLNFLLEMATPLSKRVAQIWEDVWDAEEQTEYNEIEEEVWNEETEEYEIETYEEEDTYWDIDFDKLDDEFYKFDDDWLKEVDEYLRTGKVKNPKQLPQQVLADMASIKPRLKLTGIDGNAFNLLGAANKVAKQHNIDFEPIRKEAMSGNYDHLLQTLMKHFDVV